MDFMQATGLPTWAVFDEKRSVLKLAIYCQPGAKQTQIQGLHDGRLKIRLMAAPVDGAANDEQVAAIVDALTNVDVPLEENSNDMMKSITAALLDQFTATANATAT